MKGLLNPQDCVRASFQNLAYLNIQSVSCMEEYRMLQTIEITQ